MSRSTLPVHVSVVLALVAGHALPAAAQPHSSPTYSRQGEVSPGTQAPSSDIMVRSIENGGGEALFATLEYGERVVCPRCVPLLQRKLLESDNPRVREIAAWWLRRQPYASGPVLVWLREVLEQDDDPERRARAAEALGELMDTSSFEALSQAALGDASTQVRESAVRALGRLNMEAASGVIADAFSDDAAAVRRAALSVVSRLNFFAEHAALLPLLADDDAAVRQRAARLLGERRVEEADEVLAAMLEDDTSAPARQAAAWALGRIGTSVATRALSAAEDMESDPRVLDAIEVARRM